MKQEFEAQDNWVVIEKTFDSDHLSKAEAVMSLGNGYMGIRSATEERYVKEVRSTFVAGTYNRFFENEVTELPNIADVIQMEIEINGETLDLKVGKISGYSRSLNLKNGELVRQFIWENVQGNQVQFKFLRFVSMENLHLVGQKIEMTALNKDISIRVNSGINGQMTNSGIQHFADGDKRLYDNKYLQLIQKTTQSEIDVIINTAHDFSLDGLSLPHNALVIMDRRKIFNQYSFGVACGQTLTIEKMSTIHTSRDATSEGITLETLKDVTLKQIKGLDGLNYDHFMAISAQAWAKKVWDMTPINITSASESDQLAIRFAQYHLAVMAPAHDSRMSIPAKGLSGEGYKGHVFWDTEIFMLPYFIYTNPEVAKSLLKYRYLTLEGAHEKAQKEGYEGAMFPWESAWMADGEVTPVWGAADIITGLPTKIWSGFIEQHITADVSYGIWQYYNITKDQEFMDDYGYEMILDTAKFWASRLEWSEQDQKYHINNVIGPDEYKEHVNDNAFTNYMAHWTIQLAIGYTELLQRDQQTIYQALNQKLELERIYPDWIQKLPLIYLPKPNDDNVIAQDATYLSKAIIDLSAYKNQAHVGSLFKRYSLSQVNEMQISKQADVMILFYLLEDRFSSEVKQANWDYYEPKTLHDSSLSLSTHSVLAADLGQLDLAYELFTRASQIDLGPNLKSSADGIHAASIGGLWQCVVNGFGGIRMNSGELRIEPHLPSEWTNLAFVILWEGVRLKVAVNHGSFQVTVLDANQTVTFTHKGVQYQCSEDVLINTVQ